MRSWIMMVTRPTVRAITDMPIRMAQTRRRRIARSMSAIWAEGRGPVNVAPALTLTTPNRMPRRDSASSVDSFFAVASGV
jgi:hypothetical protein